MSGSSSNKRIAKNAILLYIRTIIVLIISLYASRLILKALGAEDLGIYNVVGGIVALMAFLRTSLSKATSRFITYEFGENANTQTLSRIFSSAMTIHIIIAVLALVLGETIGRFVLEHWTDIPVNRQQAAFWIYQCALVIFCLQILTSPYESIVIAQENMSVFAYMSILSAVFKLVIVYILLVSLIDRLILFGMLMVAMDALILFLYYLYDKKKSPFFRFHFVWDNEYSKRLFAFSGWTLLGSSANAATQQGIGLLFNNFVGLIANTSLGFANQVNAAVLQFVNSFQTAFNPQIIKLYAQREDPKLQLLMVRASKFSFILSYVLALPLIANMAFVLKIWLGNVPQYTVEFCQLILICCVIDSLTGVFNTAITATGNIKGFQIGISFAFALDLMTASILLLCHLHPALVFGSRIITRGLINMGIELYFVKKQLAFDLCLYVKTVVMPIFITMLITIPSIYIVCQYTEGIIRLMVTTSVTIIFLILITYVIFLNKDERVKFLNMTSRFYRR